ncbi:MAG: hypothetical protein JXQ65_11655 [Candidatus Marinimicrobia bacterium]|nr:hypothetical protein [Candidatus Neomarinimicrobiota bacterium]
MNNDFKLNLGLNQNIVQQQNVKHEQIQKFSNVSIPETFKILNKKIDIYFPYTKLLPEDWAYEDKMLVLLIPKFRLEVTIFYEKNGPSMREKYNSKFLEYVDKNVYMNYQNLIGGSV